MAAIGIFWVYKGVVFGKKATIAEGEAAVTGIVDSPFNHVDFWDTDTDFRRQFPELAHMEYQQVPRGRVLYQTTKEAPLVYLDKTLTTQASRDLISRFFGFPIEQASWRSDLHYTTRENELDDLFDDQ